MISRSIRRSVYYPHPRERVWFALTDADALAKWLMPNDFQAVLGHEFCFRSDPAPGFDGIVHCKVLEIEAPSKLVYTWRGGPVDTTVRFSLTEESNGTRLEFEQSGFQGLKSTLVSLILGAGWKKMYTKLLPDYLASRAEGSEPPNASGCHGNTPSTTGARLERTFARAVDKLP